MPIEKSFLRSTLQRLAVCAMTVCCLGLAAFAQKPELAIQTGHSGYINAVAYSPNGRIVAGGSLDQTVKLWDMGTGLELQTLFEACAN